MKNLITESNLEIRNCIPNCKACPGCWINHETQHEIICLCCKSSHKNKEGLSN